jgi:hypothetical protein
MDGGLSFISYSLDVTLTFTFSVSCRKKEGKKYFTKVSIRILS